MDFNSISRAKRVVELAGHRVMQSVRTLWLRSLCVLLIVLVNGCAINHKYTTTPENRPYGSHSQFQFEVGDFTSVVQRIRALDTLPQRWKNSEENLLARELTHRQQYLALDTGKFYYYIWVIHNCDSTARFKPTRISVDSVVVWYGPDSLPEPVAIFMDDAIKFSDSGGECGAVRMEPIGVPKKYKNDFHVAFQITLYDRSNDSLVDRIPISLRCRRVAYLAVGD